MKFIASTALNLAIFLSSVSTISAQAVGTVAATHDPVTGETKVVCALPNGSIFQITGEVKPGNCVAESTNLAVPIKRDGVVTAWSLPQPSRRRRARSLGRVWNDASPSSGAGPGHGGNLDRRAELSRRGNTAKFEKPQTEKAGKITTDTVNKRVEELEKRVLELETKFAVPGPDDEVMQFGNGQPQGDMSPELDLYNYNGVFKRSKVEKRAKGLLLEGS